MFLASRWPEVKAELAAGGLNLVAFLEGCCLIANILLVEAGCPGAFNVGQEKSLRAAGECSQLFPGGANRCHHMLELNDVSALLGGMAGQYAQISFRSRLLCGAGAGV